MTELLLVPLSLPGAGELLPWLARRLEPTFGVRCLVDEASIDMQPAYNRARDQYDTRALLAALAKHREDALLLGVTGKDLFLPIFTFVIGEAYLGGRAAVVSVHRLSEESAGLPPQPRLLRARLLKEAVHELGHCHGLVHCSDWHCVMHASSSVEDVDLKSDELCLECLHELRAKPSAEPRGLEGR